MPNLPPMDPRLRFALAGLALLLAWIPWLGAALALGGLLFVAKDRRQGVMLGLALLLGLLSTAAFLALPEGSTGADDPRLELLEEMVQPGGNATEIDRLP